MALQQAERPLSKFRIIDADTHLSEPHDLWISRAPASLKDRVPQVKPLNGAPCWVIEGDISMGRGTRPTSAIRKDGSKALGMTFMDLTLEDVHTGSSQLGPRLEYMDANNIAAQIVYPNLLGFGGQGAGKIDFDLRLACVRIYNDAMAEMQAASGERFFPMALLPWWDIAESAREAERAKAMGLRGVNINSDPQAHKDRKGEPLKALGDPVWDALWEVCEDLSLPVNFHIGGSELSINWFGQQGWPSQTRELHAALGGAMLFLDNGRTLGNLIYSGLLDRYPKLQFVSVESGIGWIPFMLQALDYQCGEFAPSGAFELKPSEYFRRNFHACFWFERKDVSHTIRNVGVENVLFETDFPHPTCLYPLDDIAADLSELSDAEKHLVLNGNAAKLYNIPEGCS